jgi:DNA-directed RNA polymerase subunit F
LNLESHQPAEIYQAIMDGKKTEDGDKLSESEQREVYKTIFEIAIINASLSKDEFRVMAHLRNIFSIDDDEHQQVEDELRDMVKQRFEDPNVVEKTLSTLRDSVRLVTTLFDNVRKKNHGES